MTKEIDANKWLGGDPIPTLTNIVDRAYNPYDSQSVVKPAIAYGDPEKPDTWMVVK